MSLPDRTRNNLYIIWLPSTGSYLGRIPDDLMLPRFSFDYSSRGVEDLVARCVTVFQKPLYPRSKTRPCLTASLVMLSVRHKMSPIRTRSGIRAVLLKRQHIGSRTEPLLRGLALLIATSLASAVLLVVQSFSYHTYNFTYHDRNKSPVSC